METEKTIIHINLLSRAALAFVFIYHGLVPKILWLSKTEIAITNAHHLPSPLMPWIAGVSELALGVCILVLRRSLVPVYLSAALLIGLLFDTLLMMPSLLVEAFNPVTINLVSLVMAYFSVITHGHKRMC